MGILVDGTSVMVGRLHTFFAMRFSDSRALKAVKAAAAWVKGCLGRVFYSHSGLCLVL